MPPSPQIGNKGGRDYDMGVCHGGLTRNRPSLWQTSQIQLEYLAGIRMGMGAGILRHVADGDSSTQNPVLSYVLGSPFQCRCMKHVIVDVGTVSRPLYKPGHLCSLHLFFGNSARAVRVRTSVLFWSCNISKIKKKNTWNYIQGGFYFHFYLYNFILCK